ncbi:MAG: disulfide bond chaperone [Chthoniobacterales bacterium]|nr:disulfide bond chaperone [Chthoniobacterales bacterium]
MINSSEDFTQVSVQFVRSRNALLLTASFSNLFVDIILHLSNIGLKLNQFHNNQFQAALASLCLYASTRPPNESIAWTMHFEHPPHNIFIVADNSLHRVTGTLFDENIKSLGRDLLFCDWLLPGRQIRRSTVEIPFSSSQTPRAMLGAQELMLQSEQRPSRYFSLPSDYFALITAQPDCDLNWLHTLKEKDIPSLPSTEDIKLLEIRSFRWECGCNQQKILEILGPPLSKNLDLFQNGNSVQLRCPRCGSPYTIERSELEKLTNN